MQPFFLLQPEKTIRIRMVETDKNLALFIFIGLDGSVLFVKGMEIIIHLPVILEEEKMLDQEEKNPFFR